jgi:glycosyltransferase involved in cell wall biosynthesis
MMSRPTAFFVHTDLVPRGGLEAVGAWMLESLKPHYDMTVLTWSPPDLEGLNAIYGTRLRHEDARWISPGPATRRAVELFPSPTAWWQKRSWLMRMSRRLHPAHDVVLSSASEFDFGRPGIQYVNYPWMATMYGASRGDGRPAARRRLPALARRAWRPWMTLAGFRFSSMLQNLTLASSNWGAEVYRRAYGRDALTLYPPVAGAFAETPWEERRDAFVMLARLEPDKNHFRVFDILRAVRRRHPRIELHVIGTRLRTSAGEAYRRELRARIVREGGWITLHEDASRDELLRLLSRMRYGIHLREHEHFGIAVAEMVRAGLLPFVHDSGGQVEIVEESALRFSTDDEAVERIDRVLGDAALRQDVMARLRRRAGRFSPDRFGDELLQLVEAWRARHAAAS